VGDCYFEFRSIFASARFDFNIFPDDLPIFLFCEVHHGDSLAFQAQAAVALPSSRNTVVRNDFQKTIPPAERVTKPDDL